MSTQYKKFLKLLEKFPVDKTKQGRDLAQYLRDQLQSVLGASNIVSVRDEKLDKQYKALEAIANDVYLKQYPRKLSSTSTGLSGEQCRQVLSSEFLEYLEKENKN